MIFSVPQFINVEDKIAGPLTARQFLWFLAMGAILLILWNVFSQEAFYIIGIPVVLIFVALAFYRPQGVPLVVFIGYALTYLFQPKIYVWKRVPKSSSATPTAPPPKTQYKSQFYREQAKLSEEDLSTLSTVLDTEGAVHPERFDEISANTVTKKK